MSTANLSIFFCAKCNQTSNKMKYLPCDVYCFNCVEFHIKSLDIASDDFLCPFCKEIHLMPKKGFKDYQPNLNTDQIYRGENVEALKSFLIKIDESIDYLKYRVNNSSDIIAEHFLKIKNQVHAETEIVMKKIQDLRDQKLKEIDENEKWCLSNAEHKPKIEHELLNQMIELRSQWRPYLGSFSIKEAEIKKANELVEGVLKKFEEEKAKPDLLFLGIYNCNFNLFSQKINPKSGQKMIHERKLRKN